MHSLTKKAVLAAALAITSSISPVIAEEKEKGFYATLGAGIGRHVDIDIASGSGGGKIEFDTGFSGDVGFGYDFGSIRTELTYNNVNNEVDTVQGNTSNVAVEFETIFLSAYYDFRADKDWQPYAGIGFGSTTITASESYAGNITLAAGDDNITSAKVAVGINYGASENFDIYAEYSAQAYEDFTIGSYTYSDCGMNVATIGTRLKF